MVKFNVCETHTTDLDECNDCDRTWLGQQLTFYKATCALATFIPVKRPEPHAFVERFDSKGLATAGLHKHASQNHPGQQGFQEVRKKMVIGRPVGWRR